MNTRSRGIPRYRPFAGPVVFRQGFRPFFLGAGLWSVVAMALWLPAFRGYFWLPTAFDPIVWHGHEMIFGVAAAAIAGFMLTAIPNWTGRMPLQGAPLIMLFAVWVLGRAAILVSGLIGPGVAAALDLAFLTLLFAIVLREIVSGRNWRNLPMPVALVGLIGGNLLTHLEAAADSPTGFLGLRLGVAVAVLLIGTVGGRIIPSFTRNWLNKRGETEMPASAGRFDRVSMGVLLAAVAGWTVAPEHSISGALLLLAGVVTLARLCRWRGHRTLSDPLVWSLHLGFAWLPVGLLLVGLAAFVRDVPPTAGLHALTVGAIGSRRSRS